ncbi:MAG: CHASE2 domain-containing protein [Acidobacteriia bacterium]|nr:CHASE2 domain-containing protein [Terriglobia bacterium]
MKFLPNPSNARPIKLGRWLRLNGVLLGLVLLVSLSFPVSTLSLKLNDFYFQLRGPQPTSQQVALVLIDDASLDHYGRWPWHRTQLARLINAVSAQNPKAIGLDVLLSEPEDEPNDAALTQAIQSAPNLVLGSKISSSPDTRLWMDPLPRFAQAAKGVGHVQAITDFDGLCRSVPLEEPSADGLRTAFSLKLAGLVKPQLKALERSLDTRGSGLEKISSRTQLIDYRQQFEPGADPAPFVTVSAGDLLAGKNTGQLSGKAVLIGFGSIEVSDRLFTPVSDQLPMPGVEINANVLDMLLSGRSLQHVSVAWQLLALVLLSMTAIWLVVREPGVRGLVLLAAMIIAGYFGAYFLFLRFHLLISYGPLLAAGLLAAPIAQLENLLLVNREVTSRLQQLRRTIAPASDARPLGAQAEVAAGAAPAGLHWKLEALKHLQADLSSLYTFRQTLLETMREGLAVYGADGALLFSNGTWKKFCERHRTRLGNLAGVAEMAGGWPEIQNLAPDGSSWAENEVSLEEELWLFRAVRLPWTSFAEAGALLVMAEDITARRQRDQARSEALSFVTHELRTPLVSIQGFSELLMRYPNSAASSEAPATIFRETNRLVAMINTYLEVLRLDAGARPLRRTRANVRDMVAHVEKVVRPLAAAAHVPVRVEVDSEDEFVLCDETLISGALLNLVSNAIKYGARDSAVVLRVTSGEHDIEFEVHNAGPAIPAADLEHIFERFYRPQRSESIPGWGLGLSFVRRICQQHGGRVQVSSHEISGTSFLFTLPRGAMEVTEVAP